MGHRHINMPNHEWQDHEIFVFGSNLAGIHGAGAAEFAVNYCGAKVGQGKGRQGQSYAIPTKDGKLRTLPTHDVRQYVEEFLDYARTNQNYHFFVTALGTGLAKIPHRVMADLFINAPQNCRLPPEWTDLIAQRNTLALS